MRLSKDLIGKPVVSTDDGRIIGNVKDLYLDSSLTALTGIHLGKEGMLRRKAIFVSAEDVIVFGIDVILIKDSTSVHDSKESQAANDWTLLDKVQGREVDTPGGTKVGVIGDVILDEDGTVKAFALSRTYVSGPIAERRMVYRQAIIDSGNQDGVMTIDLIKAEDPNAAQQQTETPPAEKAPADEEPTEK